jgi:hypothetical protein
LTHLRYVTLTGVDESVTARELVDISKQYPFVEWGILVSWERGGHAARYPCPRWVQLTLQLFAEHRVKCSAHLCGQAAYTPAFNKGLSPVFQRVQFNGRPIVWSGDEPPNYIAQARSPAEVARAAHDGSRRRDVLFDLSKGTGFQPSVWPPVPRGCRLGYAGGLGLSNLGELLPLFDARGAEFWVDMESSLRRENLGLQDVFDLERAVAVLELAKPFAMEGA